MQLFNIARVNQLGSLQFYPDENELLDETTEISLSKKEVAFLNVFTKNPNKIIKREELSKKF
jgi:DNA-binding response OmpR family regulator